MGACQPKQSNSELDNEEYSERSDGTSDGSNNTINNKQKRKRGSLAYGNGLPSNVKTQVEAKKQRRRLSVAPNQVGKIEVNDGKETQGRRASVVSSSHLAQNTEPKKFVAISKKGFVPYNPNKVNQDAYFCDYNFGGENSNCRLFGVCDGHGEKGHLVSQLVVKKLPKYLLKENYFQDPVNSIIRATKKVSDTLKKSKINTSFSGTTLVFSLIVNNIIYTGNLGDSRVVLYTKDKPKQLSNDHKPDLPTEKERILTNGGRVDPLPGPVGEDTGPMRVWLADIDVPGLAMSRSLGDDVAHTVGVSDIPEVTQHELNFKTDKFLVYASDGVWEFLSNENVGQIVNEDLPNLRDSALKLVKQSITAWKKEEEVIDDITAVIFNLEECFIDMGIDITSDSSNDTNQQNTNNTQSN